ncbi:MAG: ArnT family glycosyltransferase [Anaerolineae bacterium]
MLNPIQAKNKIFWWDWAFLVFIILLAAFFRWRGINWDQNQHYHPDERYIAWVATSVDFLGNDSLQDAFTADKSTFNPFYWPAQKRSGGIVLPLDEQRKFAYGHVPLYLGVLLDQAVAFALQPMQIPESERFFAQSLLSFQQLNSFDRIALVGRWMSGLLDIGSVVLLFFIGRKMAGTKIGLTAAAFLAVNVMHIQQAHFFISDPALAFFVVLTLLLLLYSLPPKQEIFDALPNPTPWALTFAAVATGLAIGSKFSAIILGLPAFIVILLLSREKIVWRSIKYGFWVLLVFFVTNPFAILDTTCNFAAPDSRIAQMPYIPAACYIENISDQSSMVGGSSAFPFVRQYDGTLPYLYHIENQINWGMGAALGYTAFIAFVVFSGMALWHGYRDIKQGQTQSIWVKGLILLGWCLPYFLATGRFHVKFMRYLLPLTPFLMLFAAWLLWQIPQKWLRRSALTFVFSFTLLYAIAFSSIYSQIHPWQAASLWMVQNVPGRSVVANEVWDEQLPSTVMLDGRTANRNRVDLTAVNWLSKSGNENDSLEKLENNLETLAEADFFVVPSNRSYGVTPRLPDLYPLSGQFHQLLFDGELGYEVAFVQDRPPHIGRLYLVPDLFSWPRITPPAIVSDYFASRRQLSFVRADESFTVYDQPTVMVFRNTGRLSADEMAEKFNLPQADSE